MRQLSSRPLSFIRKWFSRRPGITSYSELYIAITGHADNTLRNIIRLPCGGTEIPAAKRCAAHNPCYHHSTCFNNPDILSKYKTSFCISAKAASLYWLVNLTTTQTLCGISPAYGENAALNLLLALFLSCAFPYRFETTIPNFGYSRTPPAFFLQLSGQSRKTVIVTVRDLKSLPPSKTAEKQQRPFSEYCFFKRNCYLPLLSSDTVSL